MIFLVFLNLFLLRSGYVAAVEAPLHVLFDDGPEIAEFLLEADLISVRRRSE